MTPTAPQLRQDLEQILRLLEPGADLSFSHEARSTLRHRATRLYEKLEAAEGGLLTVGLLGGTGVGKSTVMNALAGMEISATSHRRPHTEHVLIYRHADAAAALEWDLEGLPWKEFRHQSDSIHHLLLCDLPDFDSLYGEHRRVVTRFLEHLDVLVWITSPEKYADGRFYEFLQDVPKARQNFYFALNKVDLFFPGDHGREGGYPEMTEVIRSFRSHITGAGIPEPIVYPISAREAFQGGELEPWNQFHLLKHQLFQQRDIKQIAAIKTANLDAEARELREAFLAERIHLQRFEQILRDGLEEMDGPWLEAEQGAFDLWLERIRPALIAHYRDLSSLVGPTFFVGTVWQAIQRTGDGPEDPPDLSRFAPPEEVSARFQRRLKWLEDRLEHRLLRQNVPAPYRDRIKETLDTPGSFEKLGERFFDAVTFAFSQRAVPSFWGFRIRQVATYSLLGVFLLFALGEGGAWQGVVRSPGLDSVVHLMLSWIRTLFSSRGLAALVSYLFLNLFFGLFFYRRYGRLLAGTAEKVTDRLRQGFHRVWEEQIADTHARLERLMKKVRSQIAAMTLNSHG